jgi:hypothetical protein
MLEAKLDANQAETSKRLVGIETKIDALVAAMNKF